MATLDAQSKQRVEFRPGPTLYQLMTRVANQIQHLSRLKLKN